MTMREKMARAIFVSDGNDPNYLYFGNVHNIHEGYRRQTTDMYLRRADAALDALMEPNEAMILALIEAHGPKGTIDVMDTMAQGLDDFRAMIRAAKEGR
jgi:hypothetical protein